ATVHPPGPPASALKFGKPGWRPRSASAVVRPLYLLEDHVHNPASAHVVVGALAVREYPFVYAACLCQGRCQFWQAVEPVVLENAVCKIHNFRRPPLPQNGGWVKRVAHHFTEQVRG